MCFDRKMASKCDLAVKDLLFLCLMKELCRMFRKRETNTLADSEEHSSTQVGDAKQVSKT